MATKKRTSGGSENGAESGKTYLRVSELIEDLESEAYGVLGLTPDSFGKMTWGEYNAKRKGHQQNQLEMALLVSLAFNDPKQLQEMVVLNNAIEERRKN